MSSEDMDSLTFGATRLVRNLMAPAAAKLTINEYDYDKVGHLSTLVYVQSLALTQIACPCLVRWHSCKSVLHAREERVLPDVQFAPALSVLDCHNAGAQSRHTCVSTLYMPAEPCPPANTMALARLMLKPAAPWSCPWACIPYTA